jgi:hypothetical protein
LALQTTAVKQNEGSNRTPFYLHVISENAHWLRLQKFKQRPIDRNFGFLFVNFVANNAHMNAISPPELISRRVDNFKYTLSEIVHQLRNANPNLSLYRGTGDRWNYDPSGLIERITLRLHWAFTQDNTVGGLLEGLYYDRDRVYDHTRIQVLLENALAALNQNKSTSAFGLIRSYIHFKGQIWKLRFD